MRLSIIAALINLFFLSNNFIFPQNHQPPNKNGTILEKTSGFPYKTYEQWLQDCKSRYSFDEVKFRKEFPPEEFDNYKEAIKCPFDTYEQWVQVLKRRFRRSGFNEMAFRRKYPQEDFIKYKAEIEYMKITYLSDSLKVGGFILKPKNTGKEELPTIIYNRGGNQDIGIIDFEKLFDLFYLVSEGYILIASQYRGSVDSEGRDELGGSDVNDVLNLIPLIESLPYADSSRIGMFGWSRGGMMTYIVLTKTSRILAAVIAAGPTDFLSSLKKRPGAEDLFSKLIPDYWENKEEELKSRSAVYWAEKLYKKTPILLLQGSADWRTDSSDVLKMVSRLYETQHPLRFILFEGGDHGLNQHKEEVNDLVVKWFDKYVKNRQP